MSPEWISAIANSVTAVSLAFVGWQAFSAARQARHVSHQTKIDHERSRREKAVQLMQYWIESAARSVPARHILPMVEELTRSQCEKISDRTPFAVEQRFGPILELFFRSLPSEPHGSPIATDGMLHLDEYQVRVIKGHMTDYLNALEMVATAWRHNIADRTILEEEFYAVFIRNKGRPILEEYRRVSGVYPSISALVEALKARWDDRAQKDALE